MPESVSATSGIRTLESVGEETSVQKRRVRSRVAWLGLVFLGVAAAGCRATVPIGHLLEDPHQFDGNTVKIAGEVVGSAGVLGRGAYALDDGTGTLIIVSEARGVPRQGARVEVTGWFRSLFTWGPISGAMMLERNRQLRRWH